MAKIEVFRYQSYRVETDKWAASSRMATRVWITATEHVQLIAGSGVEIDDALLDDDGRTGENFDPRNPRAPGDRI